VTGASWVAPREGCNAPNLFHLNKDWCQGKPNCCSTYTNKRSNTSRGNNIINLYMPSIDASNFIKHTLMDLKSQIDPNTVVVEDFNTPLPPIDR
jgi:hypothetical protein